MKKRKLDITLLVAAIILFFAGLSYIIYSISFLADSFDAVSRQEFDKEQLIERFDFDKLNQVLSGKSFE